MKRRDFVYLAAAVTVLAVAGSLAPLASTAAGDESTTPFFVRGLAMVKLTDPHYLQIALPNAPHHAATLMTTPTQGEETSLELKGNMSVTGVTPGPRSMDVQLPELIKMTELYKGAVGNFVESPTVISIPWSAVRSISTDVVSEDRWTFVWAESGDEVVSFRPRRVAESLRIDLVSSAVLEVNNGESRIPLGDLAQVRTDFIPTEHSMGDFTEHFAYYMPYVKTPAEVEAVMPKKLGRPVQAASAARFGNAFAARIFPIYACFLVEVD